MQPQPSQSRGPRRQTAFGVALALAAAILAGCVSEPGTGAVRPEVQVELARLNDRQNALSSKQAAQLNGLLASEAALSAFLSNTTTRGYDGLHGSQIEHLAADGRSSLWYPGNNQLLPGQWTVRARPSGLGVCFRYGAATYNPVTGTSGSDWECENARVYLLSTKEVVAGDPLHLSAGPLPYVLPRGDISINDALKRSGRAANARNKNIW